MKFNRVQLIAIQQLAEEKLEVLNSLFSLEEEIINYLEARGESTEEPNKRLDAINDSIINYDNIARMAKAMLED